VGEFNSWIIIEYKYTFNSSNQSNLCLGKNELVTSQESRSSAGTSWCFQQRRQEFKLASPQPNYWIIQNRKRSIINW